MKISFDDIELGPIIGSGTVGTVYQGTLKSTGQRVAVKILQLAISRDKLVRARFQREMEILEKLQHPNIVRYFGGGNHQGQLFYAMEPLVTGSVKELLDRFGALTWQEVASIGRQVCSALQHAHNHGIVHRDLKPGNLFLTAHGQVKLGDFGIARDSHSADITNQGLTVGTHAYMPPEQITGDKNLTGKADLYSLGCVLFELLTGQKPFQGTNFAVLFEQHLKSPPPRVDTLIADCPRPLVNIIDQLLEKNPDQRPFSARTVQGVLLQLLDGSKSSPRQSNVASSKDVAAASVVDPGMATLALKLAPAEGRQVTWRALSLLALATLVLVLVAAFASR